jgi:hypothetical protein
MTQARLRLIGSRTEMAPTSGVPSTLLSLDLSGRHSRRRAWLARLQGLACSRYPESNLANVYLDVESLGRGGRNAG